VAGPGANIELRFSHGTKGRAARSEGLAADGAGSSASALSKPQMKGAASTHAARTATTRKSVA